MAKVLLNTRIFAGGLDLTSQSNSVAVEANIEKKDCTPFGGDGWREYKGGLKGGSIKASGFWEAGDPTKVDDYMWTTLGANGPWSVYESGGLSAAASAGLGAPCYFSEGLHSSYKQGDKVGEVAPWAGEVETTSAMVRGLGLHPPGTARIVTGSATGVEHVAVPSTARLYAALHVFSATGTLPSITVKVQSDVDISFASPVDQITFTPFIAAGGEIKSVAGPITDTFYRVSFAITGTLPSFLFNVSLGVA